MMYHKLQNPSTIVNAGCYPTLSMLCIQRVGCRLKVGPDRSGPIRYLYFTYVVQVGSPELWEWFNDALQAANRCCH